MKYDVFLSHSHIDAEWTRWLHDRLATMDYNGRKLRVWLDQEVIDPGPLSSRRELETALDRSRFLALVLTPESIGSPYVKHEIEYFLHAIGAEAAVVIQRRSCEVPERLKTCPMIEWPKEADGEEPLTKLLYVLRPEAWDSYGEYELRKSIRKAWNAARYAQPDGLDPTPTEENSALLKLLLTYDIDDPAEEGPALVGFDRVGQLIRELDAHEAYGPMMVLGEFLAFAILRHPAYAQVAARYVQQDLQAQKQPSFLTFRNRALRGATGPASSTNLLFAVARVGSKLAEIAPDCIDLSTMAAVLRSLDQRSTLANHEQIVPMMIGRALAKQRSTDLVDLLIHTLVKSGGMASHIAAAAAIATNDDRGDGLLYFTTELAELAPDLKERPAFPRPSASTARLLLDPDSQLHDNPDARDQVRISRDDFVRSFGSDWPLGTRLWPNLNIAPAPLAVENGPLVGIVRRVTLANMEACAETLGPKDIVCLTEPRIVDALLTNASGYLINADEMHAPLGQRLRNRSSRYAAFDAVQLDRFEDGSALALWPGAGDQPGWGLRVIRSLDNLDSIRKS
jgi:hypothetical protein